MGFSLIFVQIDFNITVDQESRTLDQTFGVVPLSTPSARMAATPSERFYTENSVLALLMEPIL